MRGDHALAGSFVYGTITYRAVLALNDLVKNKTCRSMGPHSARPFDVFSVSTASRIVKRDWQSNHAYSFCSK
jgi:hypothetical protein